ncbi:hypothetical protein [Tahibacter amnicola]|uniref:WD40 repeat protein n=1 Tax=Tahibacter amnicola TaxID=2976241 RepID=A0ABY6BCT8_9GAMM|nr:hypothetical protein [Tahibacter amnicola]UXI67018.1 hypothetical protein N4264_20030 [Tahibacter amnicola]
MRLSLALLLACLAPALAATASTDRSRRLTQIINGYPAASPDGRQVVFQSNRTGRYELYVMNVDGTGVRQLTDLAGDNVTPDWSPDGRRIVFAATRDNASDVFIVDVDGKNLKRLTHSPGDDEHPHWTADGTRIVFDSARTTPDPSAAWETQWHEVFSMRPDGTDAKAHTQHRALCTYASLSPDGRRLVYRKAVPGPAFRWDLSPSERNSEIVVADADGSNEINVSRNAAFDGWPRWSPDGRRIVFASNRAGPAGVGQIYVVDADGSNLRQVSKGPWSHAQPAWAADGKRVYAYQVQEDEQGEFGNVVEWVVEP